MDGKLYKPNVQIYLYITVVCSHMLLIPFVRMDPTITYKIILHVRHFLIRI